MRTKIEPFVTANDTDRWIVSVDCYMQSFSTREAAEAVYASIVPAGRHFDDTPFGCCQIIPPHYRPINKLAAVLNEPEDMTQCLVSEVQEIDLIGYISKHGQREYARFCGRHLQNPLPAWKRLENKRQSIDLFA